MKKKLGLQDLKIQSFVTRIRDEKAGRIAAGIDSEPAFSYTNNGGECGPDNSFGTICRICPVGVF
jgi:hypothetical protein